MKAIVTTHKKIRFGPTKNKTEFQEPIKIKNNEKPKKIQKIAVKTSPLCWRAKTAVFL